MPGTTGIQIRVQGVEMTGPSMRAIRSACQEVWNNEAGTGGNGGGTGTKRQISAAGRKRIAEAQRKRHAQERTQTAGGEMQQTGTGDQAPPTTTRRKRPALAKTFTAGATV